MRRAISACLLFVCLVGLVGAQPAWHQSWASYADTIYPSRSDPGAILGAKDGGAYSVTGISGFQLTKYDSTGAEQWTSRSGYAGSTFISSDQPFFLAEGTSTVFLASSANRLYPNGNQAVITAYSLSGAKKFQIYYGSLVKPAGLACDASDNVFLLSTNAQSYVISKYDSSGAPLWSLNLGPIDPRVLKLFVDQSGSVIFCAQHPSGQSANLPFIQKISPLGKTVWLADLTVASSTSGGLIDAAIATDGSIYATTQNNVDFQTVDTLWKYNPGGTLGWTAPGNYGFLCADATGVLLATNTQFKQFSPSATVLWSTPLSSPIQTSPFVNADGKISTINKGTSGLDLVFHEYDATGNLLWQKSYSQAIAGHWALTSEPPVSMTNGAIYAQVTDHDVTTAVIKLNTAGTSLWPSTHQTIDHEPAFRMNAITDAAGNTFWWGLGSAGSIGGYGPNGNILFTKSDGSPGGGNANNGPKVKLRPMPGGGFVISNNSTVRRIDAAGNQVWSVPFAGTLATDLAVDNTGNVLALYSNIIVKISSTGTQLWQAILPSDQVGAHFITTDASGNVIEISDASLTVMGICKISSAGAILWHSTFAKTFTNDYFVKVETAPNNDIYITFDRYSSGTTEGWISKYLANGDPEWSTDMSFGLNCPCVTSVLDPTHNQIYAVGQTNNAGVHEMSIFALDTATGGINWLKTPNPGIASAATDVKLDKNNYPVVTGWRYAPVTAYDYAILGMDPQGNIQKQSFFDSGAKLSEQSDGVGIDSSGNAYVYGRAIGPNNTYDFNVVKFSPPLGDDSSLALSTPLSMVTGQTYQVSVTATNQGLNTWTSADGYRLDNIAPSTWTINNIPLAGTDSIASLQSKTFTGNVKAPATPGTYNLQWKMEHNGTQFGQLISQPITVLQQTNFGQFVSQSVPTSMVAGQSYAVTVQYKNTGTNTWSVANTQTLQSTSPLNNITWKLNRLPLLNGPIAPGAVGTFGGTIVAPLTAGNYNYQWQPLQESNGLPFSTPTPLLAIPVTKVADAARYVSRSGAVSLYAGTDFYAINTMQNVGTNSWTTAGGYSLMTINPLNNVTWGVNREYIPAANPTVAPNAQVTFNGLMTAPSTPGTYTMQWQMGRSGVPFGDTTQLVTIQVYAGPDNAQFVSSTPVPTSIGPNLTFSATINMKNLGTATWGSAYSLVPVGSNNFGVTGIIAPTTAPNASAAFTATFTAPATPGTYTFRMRMAHNGTKFGQPSTSLTVVVATEAAFFVSRSGATSVNAGADFYATYSYKNTGGSTWSSATGYYLSIFPTTDTKWTATRINIPSPIGPGATLTNAALCTAPLTPGTYTMQWQMTKNGVAFGDKSPLTSITVLAAADNAQFFRNDNVPLTVVHGTTFNATVIMQNLGSATWNSTYSLVPIGTSNFGITSLPAVSTLPSHTDSFAATFTAPSTPGTYRFQWRMSHGGVKFGQPSAVITITVT